MCNTASNNLTQVLIFILFNETNEKQLQNIL